MKRIIVLLRKTRNYLKEFRESTRITRKIDLIFRTGNEPLSEY